MSEEMSALPVPRELQIASRLKESLSPTDKAAIGSFTTAHVALFGVQERQHPGMNHYQYGTTPMEVGGPLNKRTLVRYLKKRERMFFVLSRAAKDNKEGLFEKLKAEKARSEAALRALKVRPGGDQNPERKQALVSIFEDVVDQARRDKNTKDRSPIMNVLSDLFPLIPGLSSIKLGSELAFISLTRAEEVFKYVEGLDSEFAGQRDTETQHIYDLFDVIRRQNQPA